MAGTTASVVVVRPEDQKAWCAWVGDSRVVLGRSAGLWADLVGSDWVPRCRGVIALQLLLRIQRL